MVEVKHHSRVGNLRPRRKFSVFIARPYQSPGFCGHQHSDAQTATNCAMNHAQRTRRVWEVLSVNGDGTERHVSFVTAEDGEVQVA